MKRALTQLLLLAALVYLGICVAAWIFQDKLVWFPGEEPKVEPSSLRLEFSEVMLVTEDGPRIHAWYLPASEERGTLVFCHGNAGNMSHRLTTVAEFLKMGLSVLIFDYRGYGLSDGKPSEEGTYVDAVAAYDYLVDELDKEPASLLVYGESLGGAVAIELAMRRRLAGVIVENTFTSAKRLGADLYPWLPVLLLGRIDYDSASKVGDLNAPLLVLHSPDDEIVPIGHGRALYEAAPDPKTFQETSGGHNDGGFRRGAANRQGVVAFVNGIFGAPPPLLQRPPEGRPPALGPGIPGGHTGFDHEPRGDTQEEEDG